MACSSQSASDYVRQARVHLIRELKNLSAIVENLYLHKILNDGEVSELQAETDEDKTRKILDSVLRKGEAACYEFLRIIYMTRRRTSGRPSPLPEKKSEASAETTGFDLQFWISCFPFEEDTCGDMNYLQGLRPCHRYQAKLKSKAIKMSEEFWMANKCLFDKSYKPDLSYMPLVLDAEGNISPSKIKKSEIKKSMMSRAKMLKTYIPEYKPEISPSDLLKIDKNIVLVGPAGIGKTALSLEMLKLWAESDSEDLDYMFYFDMRDTSEVMKSMSLEDLLFSVFSEPDEGKEEVLDDIKKNSDNVTIIFDGITDLCSSVAWRLATKDLLPDAKIIITCRPDDEEDFFPWDFLRVEVKGFSEQSIKTYLSAALGSKQSMVLSNLELLTLCHVPMYALMVAACISSGDSPQPCTITEVYICVVRLCLQTTGSKTETRHLNSYITSKRSEILSLAEVAFYATEGKSVNLTELPIKDNTVLSFLKPLVLNISSTTYAFHHYTMQEFFAALWLLKNPDKVKAVLQQCLTEEMKHMRHLIPFMCRLLHEKNPSLMKYLIPPEELKNTSSWFLKEMISTFCDCQDEADTEGSGSSVDILFLCQCLYESQCPEACIYLLDKLDYCLDLTGECLDPYSCCAVAYVVTQSQDKKIRLDLEDVTASEQGMRCLFGCLKNVQWCDPLPRQVWEIFLLSEGQMDYISLLDLDGNWMHLPVEGKRCLYERAVHVMKMSTPKVNVCLYWDWPTPVCPSLCACLLEALPYISSLSFRMTFRGPGSQERDQDQLHGTLGKEEKRLLLDLCLRAALHKEESFHSVVDVLFSLFSVNTDLNNIHLDFYQHVQSQGYSSVIPKLRPFFQSAHGVWSIDLSQRKVSILLEVLKLQAEKKPVVLIGWSREESEVRSLLQCLPYISQLSIFPSTVSDASEFFGNLFCAAAEREQQTGEKMLELLSSVCRSETFPFHGTNMDDDLMRKIQRDFLLDLFSRVEDYEAQTGLRFLPVLQSVFQSVPAVWSADLSEGKASILPKEPKMKRRSSLSPTAKRKGVFRLSYMYVPEGKTCVPDVKLGPSRADTKPGVSEDDTKPMQPPLRFKPPLKTKCSSWMTFRGPGSQDRDQDQLHAGFPDVKLGPSRADTKPGVSEDDTKPMQPPLRFTPQLKTDSTSVSYSFKCPGPGQFQCALTGLVFVMTQKAELFYKTVQWDEGLLQSASKIAAGPLFNIKCPEDAVCQLHLPHCVSNDDLHYKRLLSVIHITDDGMSILKPLEITETHVIVKVPHLSCYGLAWPFESIWKFWRDRKVISSQVLLFLRPPNPKTQRKNLNVFLLPRNVPLEEVIAKHRNSEYIEAPSKCKLIKNQNYTVHCPNAYKIQPEEEEFDLDYGPNYHPTFEIRLPIHTEEATITVRDQANANVWEREVDLTGPGRETARSASAEDSLAAEDNLPPEDRLLLVRRRFITGVSDAVLDQLLDRLLERGVVTDDEMQLLRTKIKPEKARDFIDIVRRKGTEASSVLIAALREGDPCLFRALALS
ncbi:NACHT, LRR and PYD domains-containing protein 1b allele 1-like isoform X2 [Trachinotus anak]|uniref:NACHT, LRR and PYD domains-containing protein 1b allele 1-like isoform X2 n=1 Tax=Trachinotus anak TaxID=443729 RepID=UPI0039F1E68B